MAWEAIKPSDAKPDIMRLPKTLGGERSFAWSTRCRRLVKDCARYASTLAALHLAAFACLMLNQAALLAQMHNTL